MPSFSVCLGPGGGSANRTGRFLPPTMNAFHKASKTFEQSNSRTDRGCRWQACIHFHFPVGWFAPAAAPFFFFFCIFCVQSWMPIKRERVTDVFCVILCAPTRQVGPVRVGEARAAAAHEDGGEEADPQPEIQGRDLRPPRLRALGGGERGGGKERRDGGDGRDGGTAGSAWFDCCSLLVLIWCR